MSKPKTETFRPFRVYRDGQLVLRTFELRKAQDRCIGLATLGGKIRTDVRVWIECDDWRRQAEEKKARKRAMN